MALTQGDKAVSIKKRKKKGTSQIEQQISCMFHVPANMTAEERTTWSVKHWGCSAVFFGGGVMERETEQSVWKEFSWETLVDYISSL